jgi:UDP-glucose 4-epimerase
MSVFDKDVGRAAAMAVSHPAAAGRVFNVTDGAFHTLNEIIESFALPAAILRRGCHCLRVQHVHR